MARLRLERIGSPEVYVRPFPGPGGTWKVSEAGGFLPQWRDDGKEILYLSPDNKIMAVPISLAPAFHAGAPAALFSLQPSASHLRSLAGRPAVSGQHRAGGHGHAASEPAHELDRARREEVVSSGACDSGETS